MKEYILSVIICVIASAYICAAAPSSRSLKGVLSFLASLAVITVIISPVSQLVIPKSDGEEPEKEIVEELDHNEAASKSLAYAIHNTIKSQFPSLEPTKITVRLREDDGFTVEEITVYIAYANAETTQISQQLSNLYNCKIIFKEE